MTDLGRLKVTTPGDRELALTRMFDAPRRLVWDAFTKPELLRRWLGVQNGWTMSVCEIDLRVGGAYRYLWRGPDGADMGVRGVYQEIVRPERIVNTELFDQSWYPGEGRVTLLLSEEAGKTTATMTVLYQSREARDGVLKSPMASGVSAGYDKLAELLATLISQGEHHD